MPTYFFNSMSLREMFELRDRFSVLPSCQRDFVWRTRKQQSLIDSVLRKLPVPPIAYLEISIPFVGVSSQLVDGQQRFETICRFFRDELRTGRRFSTEEADPLYPGKLYSELPQDIRSEFDSYRLPMVIIRDSVDETIGLIFRRWQGGEPLTFAEKLYSYDGVTKDVAIRVAGHPFWNSAYDGDTKRRQPFQACIKLLILESLGTFANLTSPRLVDTLVRKNDKWSHVPDRMVKRFDTLMRLFDGSHMTATGQVVLAYQGIMLLDESGYALDSCQVGCLTKWFMRVRQESLSSQRNREGDLFSKIDSVVQQRKFWEKEWGNFSGFVFAGKRDQKRSASTEDRLGLWASQDGRCGVCGKELRFQDGIVAHHIVPYANGGPTTTDNMMLVHKLCHQHAPISQAKQAQFGYR